MVSKISCVCGEVVYFEPGKKIPLVDVEADGSAWQGTTQPKDAAGHKRDFQEQSLIFAVRENHVAIIQSVSLQTAELEDFFAWFLQSKANLVPDALIGLQNLPSKSAMDKLKDHQIKGIKFGDRLFTNVREEQPPDPSKPHAKRKRFIQRINTSPQIFNMLLSLGVSKPILDKLAANPDPGAIQVDVEISYRSRSEKEAVGVLNSLAATLGKQDGLDTEIRLDGNSSIKGDELTVRGSVAVQSPDGCISVDDAFAKLSRWLAEQIQSGTVA
ncbi:MAG: hypothetical protein EBS05_05460 [Proteobacteria bacterium]|nr:hypothetical protein [Pseudomonadota bacterium]